jgi:hypothetical protein
MSSHVGWAGVQENNERVNAERRKLKETAGFLNQILASSQVTLDESEIAQNTLKSIEVLDESFTKAYLDSGYAYDSGSTRAMRDWAFDTWQENERAREGSTLQEGIESEIRQEITLRHAQEQMSVAFETFDSEVMSRLMDGECDSLQGLVHDALFHYYDGMDDHGDHDY